MLPSAVAREVIFLPKLSIFNYKLLSRVSFMATVWFLLLVNLNSATCSSTEMFLTRYSQEIGGPKGIFTGALAFEVERDVMSPFVVL